MAISLVARVASELERRLRLLAVLVVGFGYLLVQKLDATPYDDAYFFKRFALNFLDHGSFAWNPGDGPVYGLTSQLHAFVAVVVAAAAPGYFVVATKVFLTLCLVIAAWLVVGLAERLSGRYDVAVGVTLLSVGCPLAAWTMHTGMETALAFLVTTGAFCAIFAPSPPRTHPRTAAVATALVYLCRPDLALLPAVTFLGANLRERRRVVLYLVWLGALLAALLLAFRLYYGTALPLPFYAKTLGLAPYDAALRELGAHDKLVHLATFLAFSAPLLLLSRPFADARSAALVVASVAFVAYHAFITSEIMGYRARLYAPALIPLALAAALGAPRHFETPRAHRALLLGAWILAIAVGHRFGLVASASAGLERVAWPAFVVQIAIAGWLTFSDDPGVDDRSVVTRASALFLVGALAVLPPRWGGLPSDREFLEKSSAEVTTTRGLFDVERCLPNVSTVYHSEIGVPGLVLPHARIVDLAGLMSRSITLERPRFDAYCLRDRPEVVFLPHRNYVEQNREIAASTCLRSYTRVVERSSSPLYVRNDLVDAFGRCARDVARFR